VAFIAGMGFVLTSTAIVMQLLTERGDLATPGGQKIVSILLLEDLAIVPLLAAVAILGASPAADGASDPRWLEVVVALAAVVGVVAVSRYLLNPLFSIFAAARAREVMTAAALLVVLGAALAMELTGLSMAMGAFIAGVILSESSFRHELEADIEPFRGLLLGLFFLGVGMSLDLSLVAREWPLLIAIVVPILVLLVFQRQIIKAVGFSSGTKG
jgi:glutathione-regulated potassium-efflux system protein KefB